MITIETTVEHLIRDPGQTLTRDMLGSMTAASGSGDSGEALALIDEAVRRVGLGYADPGDPQSEISERTVDRVDDALDAVADLILRKRWRDIFTDAYANRSIDRQISDDADLVIEGRWTVADLWMTIFQSASDDEDRAYELFGETLARIGRHLRAAPRHATRVAEALRPFLADSEGMTDPSRLWRLGAVRRLTDAVRNAPDPEFTTLRAICDRAERLLSGGVPTTPEWHVMIATLDVDDTAEAVAGRLRIHRFPNGLLSLPEVSNGPDEPTIRWWSADWHVSVTGLPGGGRARVRVAMRSQPSASYAWMQRRLVEAWLADSLEGEVSTQVIEVTPSRLSERSRHHTRDPWPSTIRLPGASTPAEWAALLAPQWLPWARATYPRAAQLLTAETAGDAMAAFTEGADFVWRQYGTGIDPSRVTIQANGADNPFVGGFDLSRQGHITVWAHWGLLAGLACYRTMAASMTLDTNGEVAYEGTAGDYLRLLGAEQMARAIFATRHPRVPTVPLRKVPLYEAQNDRQSYVGLIWRVVLAHERRMAQNTVDSLDRIRADVHAARREAVWRRTGAWPPPPRMPGLADG